MRRIERILEEACGTEFTAVVARIEQRGLVIFERAYGTTRADLLGRPIYADTIFDLASLTKLFVTTLLLQLVNAGLVALDEPLSSSASSRVAPRRTSGYHRAYAARAHVGDELRADYRSIVNENVEEFALRCELIAEPGERVIYSDLGFIALGVVMERVTGLSLQALASRSFPNSLTFRPRNAQRSKIPATEEDGWRGRVQGFVHDEKAYLMGGVAGHAGLFGTAADVATLAESYLGPLQRRAATLLPEKIVRDAIAEQAYDAVLRRGLGWALKTSDENSCGRFMDRSSFGHTGFVGTCVWADPSRDLQGVLLTNAVYFGRGDTRDMRARFYDAMVEECSPSD